jgi:hypothetical protein
MIGPIHIDLSELQQEFALKETQVEELGVTLVNAITDRIFNNWRVSAMNGLNSTRKSYIQALNIGEISSTKKYIQLTGVWPNMIENGFGAFDMKPGMLGSSKAKVTKKGTRFITIPFRWASSGSIGESEVFANVMPVEINTLVRRLRPTTTNISSRTNSGGGLQLKQLPKDYQIPKSRGAFSDLKSRTTYPQYTHKGSIYEGIIRNETTYERATQSSYVSFRRVSEKSDPMSWIHKAQAAKNFAEQGLKKTDVASITDRTIDEFLSNAGF